MAPQHKRCVSLPVLLGVKNYLESTIQRHVNSLEEKVQKTQEQWEDLVLKVEVLEEEVRSSRNEVGNLRFALISEREKREEEGERNRKLTEIIEELRGECVRLEEKIVEFEERPLSPSGGGPPPGDNNGVLGILNELVSDTTSNFERWNGRQAKLEEEVQAMKKVLQQPTGSAQSPHPPVTPVVDYCIPTKTPEKEPNSYSGVEIPERSPNPPVLSPAHSPFRPPPEEDDEVMLYGSPSLPRPNSEPNFHAEPSPVDNSISLSRSDGSSRWDQEHGMNPENQSGKFCLCGSSFNSKVSLQNHIFYFTQEWKFTCQFCKMRFHGYTLLRKHLRSAHDVMAIPGEEKTFGCRQCGAVLKTRLQCATHLRVVHGKGQGSSIVTKLLNKSVSSVARTKETPKSSSSTMPPRKKGRPHSAATRHGFDHARLLYCLCGRKFAGGLALMNHVNYHTIKTFLCKVCDKRFSYKCHLKIHLTRVHKFPITTQEAGASGVMEI